VLLVGLFNAWQFYALVKIDNDLSPFTWANLSHYLREKKSQIFRKYFFYGLSWGTAAIFYFILVSIPAMPPQIPNDLLQGDLFYLGLIILKLALVYYGNQGRLAKAWKKRRITGDKESLTTNEPNTPSLEERTQEMAEKFRTEDIIERMKGFKKPSHSQKMTKNNDSPVDFSESSPDTNEE
jgi:hypothetical protein